MGYLSKGSCSNKRVKCAETPITIKLKQAGKSATLSINKQGQIVKARKYNCPK